MIYVYDKADEDKISAFWIEYGNDYLYHVGKCSEPGVNTKFPISPSTETSKVWRISENRDSLDIFYNGVTVLHYELEKGYQNDCGEDWGKDAARIKFPENDDTLTTDTASETYRVARRIIFSKYQNRRSYC